MIQRLGMQISTYPVQPRGKFSSSDATLDRVWQVSVHTLQLCMEDSYMDTPWRERGSWLGDVNVAAQANYYAFGDTALIRRFLIHHARGQQADGTMQGKYPGRCSSHISTWSLMFALALDDYVRYTGDIDLAKELWPVVQRTAAWLERYRMPEGVFGNFPLEVTPSVNIYTFIDWAPVNTAGCNAAFNAFAYAFFKAVSRLARRTGHVSQAQVYENRQQNLAQSFATLFWDPQRGVFVSGYHKGKRHSRWGCHENYLALLFNLGDESQRESIINRLTEHDLAAYFTASDDAHDSPLPGMAIVMNRYRWDDRKMVPIGTPYFSYWVMLALCKQGRVEQALHLIRVLWGNILKQGGTTTWEKWDRSGSLTHGFGSGPITILGRYVLGVRWEDCEQPRIHILPHRPDLPCASGCVPTPHGEIEVRWRWDGAWNMEATIPRHERALLGLPWRDVAGLVLDGQPVQSPSIERHDQTDFLCVEVGPGHHQLTS